jgi:hypothetical protein
LVSSSHPHTTSSTDAKIHPLGTSGQVCQLPLFFFPISSLLLFHLQIVSLLHFASIPRSQRYRKQLVYDFGLKATVADGMWRLEYVKLSCSNSGQGIHFPRWRRVPNILGIISAKGKDNVTSPPAGFQRLRLLPLLKKLLATKTNSVEFPASRMNAELTSWFYRCLRLSTLLLDKLLACGLQIRKDRMLPNWKVHRDKHCTDRHPSTHCLLCSALKYSFISVRPASHLS